MCLYLHSRPLVRQSSNGLHESGNQCRSWSITLRFTLLESAGPILLQQFTLQSVQLHLLQNSTQTRLCRFPFVVFCLS